MSEKHQIDDLFREGLDHKGLEYKEAYWEQMEALLARKKRRTWKKRLGYGTGLLLLIAIVFLSAPAGDEVSSGRREESALTPPVHAPEMDFTERASTYEGTANPAAPKGTREKTPEPEPAAQPDQMPEVSATARHQTDGSGMDTETDWNTTQPGVPPTARASESLIVPRSEPTVPAEVEREPSVEQLYPETLNGDGSPSRHPLPEFWSIRNREHTIPGFKLSEPSLFPLHTTPEQIRKAIRRLPSARQWYLEPTVGYGWLRHRTNDEIRAWKTANEQVQPYRYAGLELRVSMRRFSFSLGGGLRQWTEQTNYRTQLDHYTFDTSFRMVQREYLQRPDGSYVALLRRQVDTVSHFTTDTVYCPDCPVRFRYLTLPLAVQYEFGRGRWLYQAGVGLNFSFLLRGSGEYGVRWNAAPGQIPAMQTGGASGTWLSGTVVQAGMSLGVKYRFHPQVSLTGRFRYERSLNSMMVQYRQETDYYGVALGLEWRLRE